MKLTLLLFLTATFFVFVPEGMKTPSKPSILSTKGIETVNRLGEIP